MTATATSAQLSPVQLALEEWGRCMREAAGAYSSYPSSAAFAKTPGVGTDSDMTPTAMAMDAALAKLKTFRRELYRVVCEYYWHQAPTRVACDGLGISAASYRNYRQMAEHFVAGATGLESGVSLTRGVDVR